MRKKNQNIWKLRYQQHKDNARSRRIPFLFTFDEWCVAWRESGKWKLRGSRRGQYCMARRGDQGAYEIDNVVICLAEKNRAERNQNYPLGGTKNPAYGKNYWTTMSSIQKEKRRSNVGKAMAKPKSSTMRASLSQTALGRRMVWRNGMRTWAYMHDVDHPTGGTF